MAYDAESNRIVLFGGNGKLSFCGLADTWVYDIANNSWQDMSPAVAPPGRCCAGMAYDSEAGRVILFGGYGAGAIHTLNDTWAYDLNANTWTNMNPAVSPPGRTGGALVYDVRLDRLILFGGHADATGGYLAKNDTWTYDLNSNTWTRAMPVASPPLRAFAAMAYDVESDRVVLFGGETEPNSFADSETWAYDAANETWERMTPATSPARRFGTAAVYDAKADRVLVFGGTGYPDNSGRNDTWAYDFNADAWSKIDTASKPSDRLSAMAYDARSDRTVLFGGSWPWAGVGTPVYNRETWVFDRDSSTWTRVLGPLPPVATVTFSPSSPAPGDTVTFDGSSSNDPDGTVVLFAWDFGGGASLGARANYTFASAGTFTVALTVTDDEGLTNTTTTTVHVTAEIVPLWVWPLVVVGIAAVAVAAFILIRRRRRPVAQVASPPPSP